MRVVKGLILAAGVALLLLVIVACEGRDASLLESVPSNTTILGSVQLQKALEDGDIQDLSAQLIPLFGDVEGFPTLDETLREAGEESGIDFKAIEEIVLFFMEVSFSQELDIEDLEGGIFFKGTYDRERVLSALKREEGPLDSTTYKGEELYTSEEDSALVFLEEELLVLGSPAGVRAVLDVRAGDADAVSGELRDSFREMGSPLAKVSILFPEGALEEALEEGETGFGEFPIDLSIFTQIRSIGLSVDKRREDLTFQATLGYPDAATASKADEGLSALIGFLKVFTDSSDLNEVLDKVQISSFRDRVTIAAEFGVDEFQEALRGLAIQAFPGGSGARESPADVETRLVPTSPTDHPAAPDAAPTVERLKKLPLQLQRLQPLRIPLRQRGDRWE